MKPLKSQKHLGIENGPLIAYTNNLNNLDYGCIMDIDDLYSTVLRLYYLNPSYDDIAYNGYNAKLCYASGYKKTYTKIDRIPRIR